MKLPRLTIKRMMVLVAVLAVASLIGRAYWENWLRYRNPVEPSQIAATIDPTPELKPGQTAPVSITYNFLFSARHKPAPGTTVTVIGSVWLEDHETGCYVDGYTFDAPLTVGERETASGKFAWDALVPRPGLYMLRYTTYHTTPLGLKYSPNGGGRGCHIGMPNP